MICSQLRITLPTTEPIQLIDITQEVKNRFQETGLKNGVLTIISNHTTAYVNLNEREELLQNDMITYLKRLVPKDGNYAHNLNPIDGRHNAHSHLMGLFMNASETIPFFNGELTLGTWQSVFFVELDGPREKRNITLQFLGE